MVMFFPSTYPRSRRPCRNPSNWGFGAPSERPGYRKPIWAIFFRLLCLDWKAKG
jgi:hypothetical protein